MSVTNDIPRIASDWWHIGGDGRGYDLSRSQISRKKKKKEVYKRDEVIAPYEVNKGKWV